MKLENLSKIEWIMKFEDAYSVWSDAGGDDKLQINFTWPYS